MLCAGYPSLVCNVFAGCKKRSTKRGRPAEPHTQAAASSHLSQLNNESLEATTSHSSSKHWFSCCCNCKKHVRYMSCHAVSNSNRALNCRVCADKGSSYEKALYNILDQLACVEHYAVEAYAISGQYQHEGKLLNVSKHAWDVVLPPPLNIVLEVQGEQHVSKLDTRRNSNDQTLADRASRDHGLAAAAQQAGFQVVWLQAADEATRRRSWRQVIKQAVHDAEAGRPPRLYMA